MNIHQYAHYPGINVGMSVVCAVPGISTGTIRISVWAVPGIRTGTISVVVWALGVLDAVA